MQVFISFCTFVFRNTKVQNLQKYVFLQKRTFSNSHRMRICKSKENFPTWNFRGPNLPLRTPLSNVYKSDKRRKRLDQNIHSLDTPKIVILGFISKLFDLWGYPQIDILPDCKPSGTTFGVYPTFHYHLPNTYDNLPTSQYYYIILNDLYYNILLIIYLI